MSFGFTLADLTRHELTSRMDALCERILRLRGEMDAEYEREMKAYEEYALAQREAGVSLEEQELSVRDFLLYCYDDCGVSGGYLMRLSEQYYRLRDELIRRDRQTCLDRKRRSKERDNSRRFDRARKRESSCGLAHP